MNTSDPIDGVAMAPHIEREVRNGLEWPFEVKLQVDPLSR